MSLDNEINSPEVVEHSRSERDTRVCMTCAPCSSCPSKTSGVRHNQQDTRRRSHKRERIEKNLINA